MFLGIEIGGTKLQLGVGPGDGGPLVALERLQIVREDAAEGIRRQIATVARPLVEQHGVRGIGIGFGGPVDAERGRTIKSHQIEGWTGFPLADWCRDALGRPAVVANDADTAGLAEARFGAGQGRGVVFYITIGSGIGGALIIDGGIYRGGLGMAAELGHLRPGLQSDRPDQTVESMASGWAIAEAAQARLTDPVSHQLGAFVADDKPSDPETIRQRLIECEEADEQWAGELLDRCDGQAERLTTKMLAEAAREGNGLAVETFRHAATTLGWAIAQMVTLVAPQVVVLGGGVSLVDEAIFLDPVRKAVDRYVFPPFREKVDIVPAALGEEVVVHGAVALARE